MPQATRPVTPPVFGGLQGVCAFCGGKDRGWVCASRTAYAPRAWTEVVSAKLIIFDILSDPNLTQLKRTKDYAVWLKEQISFRLGRRECYRPVRLYDKARVVQQSPGICRPSGRTDFLKT